MTDSLTSVLPALAQASTDLQGGEYFSLAKIIVMLALAIPWLYFAPWVQKDAKRIHSREMFWSLVILAAGALGMLLWLLLPMYVVGLLLYVVLTGAAYAVYILHRNQRVPVEAKVLTGAFFADLLKKKEKQITLVESKIKMYRSDSRIVLPPQKGEESEEHMEAYAWAQDLLYDVIYYRAGEADISPEGETARVRFVIDGVPADQAPLPTARAETIINFLKPLAGMDANERRRPQKGKMAVDLAGNPVDIMLATAGTVHGQRLQLRIVQEAIRTNIEELGMAPAILARIKELSQTGRGLTIVAGKPGNGLTSTMYSMLRTYDLFIKQVVTLEAKPPIDLENVTQNSYGEAANLLPALTTALRRDPDVVLVDFCEDAPTAALINQHAANKNLLLGMHASDTFMALAKWIKISGDPAAAVANLNGVLCQVLVRKLCPNCRESYKPDPQMLAKANLPTQEIKVFYRPPTGPLLDDKGKPMLDKNGKPIPCPTCQGSGYFGRTAVYEWLEMTDEIRELVKANTSLQQIKIACRKNKMLYLQEQALQKVVEGLTGIAEVLRVSQPPVQKK